MRTAYRVLAYLIAVLVVVQAAVIAYAITGMSKWIQQGGVLDKATMESEDMAFPEEVGFMVHGIGGMTLIPLVALILLVVSFFTRTPKASMFAGAVFGLIVLQILLGSFSRGAEMPFLSLLHGANALLVFIGAVIAARHVRRQRGAHEVGADAVTVDRAGV